MADTLPNIPIPKGTFVNLYTASGIAVGTQIIVENIGQSDVRLFTRSSAPADPSSTGYNIVEPYSEKANESGDSGAFAWSIRDGLVNVREA